MIKFLKRLLFNSNQSDYFRNLRTRGSIDRDYSNEFRYKKSLVYDDFKNLYDRFGIAKRIVEIFPNYIWSNDVSVFNPDEKENDPNSLKKSV